MVIKKIVLTGGPCGGKTSGINSLKAHLESKGFLVLVMPETATELIECGISPQTCIPDVFQKALLLLQIQKEQSYEIAAESMGSEKVVILLDRGVLDGKAYMSNFDAFDRLVESFGFSTSDFLKRYDAVFHLVTAADGAEDYYSNANNSARYETSDEAIIADRRIVDAWSGHKNHFVFNNSTDFDEKIDRIIKTLDVVLD